MLFASWNNSYPGHPALTCYSNTITCAYMHVNEHETISHIQAHTRSMGECMKRSLIFRRTLAQLLATRTCTYSPASSLQQVCR